MSHIALLDCNNFFVSCERLFRPDLAKRPVVVLSSNDGCVVARSQEIKDMGIPMGVPYFQIKDILKKAKTTIFSSHFALYRDISRRVFEVVRSRYSCIEQYSIDECFISFDSENPVLEMQELRRLVEREVGIPVSVGIAASKTQAKFASARAKKAGGVIWFTTEDFLREAKNIKLGELWGVGKGRVVRFLQDQVLTVDDLLLLPHSVVSARYGVEGRRLQEELLGNIAYPLQKKRLTQQSLMSTRSFAEPSDDPAVVKDALLYHLYHIVEDLQAMNLETQIVRIIIAPSRHGAYALWGESAEVRLPEATADLFLLQRTVIDLFEGAFKPNVPYKKAGVLVGSLVSPAAKTPGLFADLAATKKTKQLTETLLSVNKNLGGSVLQLGRLTEKVPKWSVKCGLLSPAYTTNWNDLQRVKASHK